MGKDIIKLLERKALYVRRETLKLHLLSPETRIASSLSAVEIFSVLYYGGILRHKPANPMWEKRDRLIISKGHGGISLYPVLADLKFFPKNELGKIGKPKALLKSMPDCLIPGIESINGALGNGLGEACGIAIGARAKGLKSRVFVICGDGELNEGSVWEAIMFAGHKRLSNVILILDNNKISMMGYCRNILNLNPLAGKFKGFGWEVYSTDGHSVDNLYRVLMRMKVSEIDKPKVLIANTVKGRGVPELEKDILCHVRSLSREKILESIEDME